MPYPWVFGMWALWIGGFVVVARVFSQSRPWTPAVRGGGGGVVGGHRAARELAIRLDRLTWIPIGHRSPRISSPCSSKPGGRRRTVGGVADSCIGERTERNGPSSPSRVTIGSMPSSAGGGERLGHRVDRAHRNAEGPEPLDPLSRRAVDEYGAQLCLEVCDMLDPAGVRLEAGIGRQLRTAKLLAQAFPEDLTGSRERKPAVGARVDLIRGDGRMPIPVPVRAAVRSTQTRSPR